MAEVITLNIFQIEVMSDGSLRWYEVVDGEKRPANISIIEQITRRIAEHCSREITAIRAYQMITGEGGRLATPNGGRIVLG